MKKKKKKKKKKKQKKKKQKKKKKKKEKRKKKKKNATSTKSEKRINSETISIFSSTSHEEYERGTSSDCFNHTRAPFTTLFLHALGGREKENSSTMDVFNNGCVLVAS